MFATAVKLLSTCCEAVDPSAAGGEGWSHGKLIKHGKQA